MSRDPSGTYSLASGNPVVSGTIIESTWANPTMDDLATALSDSLSRSGKGGMLAPMRLQDGAVGLPGMSFLSEVGMGFYRFGLNDFRFSTAGEDVTRWKDGNFEEWDGNAWVKPIIALPDPSIEAGSVMLFVQAAAPTGWTKDTTHNDKSLRIVSGDGGGIGGTTAFTTVFAARATAAAGGHDHGGDTGAAAAGFGGLGFDSQENPAAHDHSISSVVDHTHTLDMDVLYVDTIICTKDA